MRGNRVHGKHLVTGLGSLLLIGIYCLVFQLFALNRAGAESVPETVAYVDSSTVTGQGEDAGSNMNIKKPRLDDIIVAFIYMIFILLLFRTAYGTLNSRFLRHLAYAIFPGVVFRIGRFIYEWQLNIFSNAEIAWSTFDIMVSIVGTYWLFLAWRLITNYPNQSVDRAFFTISSSIVGAIAGILGVISSVIPVSSKNIIWVILFLIDSLLACIAFILIGTSIIRKLKPQNVSLLNQKTLKILVVVPYIVWGILQLPYPLGIKNSPTYLNCLFVSAVCSLLMTMIYTSLSLEDRFGVATNQVRILDRREELPS